MPNPFPSHQTQLFFPHPTPICLSCYHVLQKSRMRLQEDIAAAGQVVETTRDPMFRDPKTNEYLG